MVALTAQDDMGERIEIEEKWRLRRVESESEWVQQEAGGQRHSDYSFHR
jgi:hypothetical protein